MWREKLLGITGFATTFFVIGVMGLIVFSKNMVSAGHTEDAIYYFFKSGVLGGVIASLGLTMIGLGLFFIQGWARMAAIVAAIMFDVYFIRLVFDFFAKTDMQHKSDSLIWIFIMTPLFIYSVFGIVYFLSAPVTQRFNELKEILKK